MSLLDDALALFSYTSIDDITVNNLKKALKKALLSAHPDKNDGNDTDIDRILQSYVYLSETLARLSGGRATLQNIISPDELKGSRADEIINKVLDEFNNDEFNALFEQTHVREAQQGYESWLKADSDSKADDNHPPFTQDELNDVFVQTVKAGKLDPESIILHPDEMALYSGKNLGISLIHESGGTFTSDPNANPEYTDLFTAYTSDNTIYDKIPAYIDTPKTLEDILSERSADILPSKNDLEQISAWEKKRIEEEKKHLEQIKGYFGGELKSGLMLGEGAYYSYPLDTTEVISWGLM
jgi:hypothetical protein